MVGSDSHSSVQCRTIDCTVAHGYLCYPTEVEQAMSLEESPEEIELGSTASAENAQIQLPLQNPGNPKLCPETS